MAAVLEATQVKATRESGSVTLNSADVLAAVRNFWALRAANPGRVVRLLFLTTSHIGRERAEALAKGGRGLDLWTRAARGGPVAELRAALRSRFGAGAASGHQDAPPDDDGLAAFLAASDDETLRRELLRPVARNATSRLPPFSKVMRKRDHRIKTGRTGKADDPRDRRPDAIR